jgi:hypothetical protein
VRSQRQQPGKPLAHGLDPPRESLEHLCGLGRGARDAHVVAGVDHGLHSLRVAHERRAELALACVVARGVLELGVQEPHQHGVEARLALERGGERVPGPALERLAEAAAARALGRRPEPVQLGKQLADLGAGLLGERDAGLLVELGERRRVGGFFVLEPEAQRLEGFCERLRVGHGGL